MPGLPSGAIGQSAKIWQGMAERAVQRKGHLNPHVVREP
jgi:hypothetical protein